MCGTEWLWVGMGAGVAAGVGSLGFLLVRVWWENRRYKRGCE